MKLLFVSNGDLAEKTAKMLTSYCSGNGFIPKSAFESLNADELRFKFKGDLSVDVLDLDSMPVDSNISGYNLIVGFDKRQVEYMKDKYGMNIPLFSQVACCDGDKTAVFHEESARFNIPTFAYKMTIYNKNS